MAGNRKLTIEILGDAKDATKAFGEVEGSADGFGKKMSGSAKVAGVAMLGIAGGALAMIPSLLEGGVELDALAKKAETVFGDSLGDVKAWAKENAGAMGLTTSGATAAAASIADLLKPMGFTSEAAATMSTDMLDLSGALSAWTGGTTDAAEVSEIITKAMLGETDGLKALGISISAADIKARLAAKGQGELTGAALEQAEALAIQELIMEKSTDAQTAWANGSMDGMKAQNEAKASIEQMKESLTTALYPALQALVPIITDVAVWLGENLPGAIAVVKDFIETKLLPVIKAIADFFGEVVGWVQKHWDTITSIIQAAILPIKVQIGLLIAAVELAIAIFKEIWHAVLEPLGSFLISAFKTAWDVASIAIGLVKDATVIAIGVFKDIWNNVLVPLGSFLGAAFSVAWGAAQTAINLAKGAVDIMFTAAKGLWDNVLSPVAGFVSGAFSLAWSTAGTAIGLVKGIFDTVASVVRDLWLNVMIPVGNFLGAGFKTAWDTAGTAIGLVKSGFDGVVTVAKDLWHNVLEPVVDFFEGAWKTGIGVAKGAVDTLKGAFQSAKETIRSVINTIIGWWNNLSFTLPGVDVGPFHTPGFTLSTPNIPTLHSGGIVPGNGNEEVLGILRAGEVVFNEDQKQALGGMLGGRGGPTIVQHFEFNPQFNGAVMMEKDAVRHLWDMFVDGQHRGELVGTV